MKHIFIVFIVLWMFITLAPAQEDHWIPDANLREAVIEALELPDGTPLTKEHLKSLKSLSINDGKINDLTGLEHALALNYMSACRNSIKDLEPLADLVFLKNLFLCENSISDISPLTNLKRLTQLDLSKNQIRDITPLGKLNVLKELALSHNLVENITVLGNLKDLNELQLQHNRISDIRPLVNLPKLENLYLQGNPVKNITPLLDLNLVIFIYDEPAQGTDPPTDVDEEDVEPIQGTDPPTDVDEEDVVDGGVDHWMPDANLRAAVIKQLKLPEDVPLTKEHLKPLTKLEIPERSGVRDLTGLEHAVFLKEIGTCVNPIEDLQPLANLVHLTNLTFCVGRISDISPLENLPNLTWIDLGDNQISDITPLRNLTKLEGIIMGRNLVEDITAVSNLKNLKRLYLNGNRVANITAVTNLENMKGLHLSDNHISDIRPISNLIALEGLYLANNLIEDITAVSNLKNLRRLQLNDNRISDVTPLLNLSTLEELYIQGNPIDDVTPLFALDLAKFEYDEVCKIEQFAPSIEERIITRPYPSVLGWSNTIKFEGGTKDESLALFDLQLDGYYTHFPLTWSTAVSGSETNLWLRGTMAELKASKERRLAINPNMLILYPMTFNAPTDAYPMAEDSEYWLRDADGNIATEYAGGQNEPQVNFMLPAVQELIIKHAVGVAACGLYDGILLDNIPGNDGGFIGSALFTTSTGEERVEVTKSILQEIRKRVPDKFLIMISAGRNKFPHYKEYLNGSFIENAPNYPGGYHYQGLTLVEDVLTWDEENLRYPQINCLQGMGIKGERPDSPENLRNMRVITTLGLTHSDGYVTYNPAPDPEDPSRRHIWYDFWDADLGQPIGAKARYCDNCEGFFIREFTNGWAVYNRSGRPQAIQLPMQATGVASGITGAQHTIPDLDGDILLKQDTAVLTGGVVKVLDPSTVDPKEVESDWMPDPNLREAIIKTLELPEGTPLRKDQMRLLRSLVVINREISDLTGLEHAEFLYHIDVGSNQIVNLKPLANLVYLNNIALNGNKISDISSLANANLSNLGWLNLSDNQISNITPLKNLTKLRGIDLTNNLVEDISGVENLGRLEELWLNNNRVTDISPILKLPALKRLSIKGNPVKNIAPLFDLDLVEFQYDESQLETEPSPDVNGDGEVNILDLVTIANAFGEAEPDLNGDGVVNIQDLVIVANAF